LSERVYLGYLRNRPLCMNGTENWDRVHAVNPLWQIARSFARVQKMTHPLSPIEISRIYADVLCLSCILELSDAIHAILALYLLTILKTSRSSLMNVSAFSTMSQKCGLRQ